MPEKILVTGASGFIATHTILELLNHGYTVRGTVRSLARADAIRALLSRLSDRANEVEFVQAELTETAGWASAMSECNGVFHIAAPVPIVQPKNANDLIQPARQGTLNVLAAASRAGIGKVVMTSSVAAVWGRRGQGSRTYDASDWSDPQDPDQSPYSLSKTLAERAAWDFVSADDTPALVVINPAIVLGPALEMDYGSSLKLLYKLLRGELPLSPKLGFEIVDVRDVALLHRLAYESTQANGQRLMCSAGFLWLREIAQHLAENFPDYARKLPSRDMPNVLMKLAALFVKDFVRYLPELEVRREIDSSATTALLDWQPRSPAHAVVAGARSLIDLNLV